MKKAELLSFIDKMIEAIKTRGGASTGVTRTRMRKEYESVTAVRAAIVKHVPADPISPLQTEIDPFRPR